MDEIVRAYHAYAVAQSAKGLPAVHEVEDSVAISAAAGRSGPLAESLRLAGELAAVWPKSRLPLDWTDAGRRLGALEAGAEDVGTLTATVDGQIAKHKLAKIIDSTVDVI